MAWRGMPNISTSIGAVMRASTSSGVMPGALMMILTWGADTSTLVIRSMVLVSIGHVGPGD